MPFQSWSAVLFRFRNAPCKMKRHVSCSISAIRRELTSTPADAFRSCILPFTRATLTLQASHLLLMFSSASAAVSWRRGYMCFVALRTVPHSPLPRVHGTAANLSPFKMRRHFLVAVPNSQAHRLARAGSDPPRDLFAHQMKVRRVQHLC